MPLLQPKTPLPCMVPAAKVLEEVGTMGLCRAKITGGVAKHLVHREEDVDEAWVQMALTVVGSASTVGAESAWNDFSNTSTNTGADARRGAVKDTQTTSTSSWVGVNQLPDPPYLCSLETPARVSWATSPRPTHPGSVDSWSSAYGPGPSRGRTWEVWISPQI